MPNFNRTFDRVSSDFSLQNDSIGTINGVKEGSNIKSSSLSKTVGNTIGRNNIYYKHIDKAQAKYSDSKYCFNGRNKHK